MREILFRGKQIDNCEWVYGFYFCMHHDDDREHLHHFIIPLNVPLPKDKTIGEIQVEVDPDTVGQCVSDLPDKNGKKIFEGDIISSGYFCNFFVEYSEEDTEYQANFGDLSGSLTTYLNPKESTVIGNIHDNPELMEVN